MDIIENPHDALFKRTLTDKEVARNFLENYLPDDILNEIDLRDIKVVKDSFIDKNLKESFSDILYNVKIKDRDRDGYIYLLFEHKSYPDSMVAVQLLGYITDIWKLYYNQSKAKSLPLIIPVLLYHGQRKWNSGSKLSDVLNNIPPELDKYIPDYNYLLYDFSQFTDQEIKGEIKLRLFLKIISFIFSNNLENGLKRIMPLINKLKEKESGMDYLETVVKYILNTGEEMTLTELSKKVDNISYEGSEIIMTIAERLREEGRKEGREEGRIEAMKEMIVFALDLKFGMSSKFLKENIKKIDDYDQLKEIKNAIRNYDHLDKLTDHIDI